MTSLPPDLNERTLNLLNCGVIVVDAGMHVALWNKWLVPRCGQSAQRALGQHLCDVFPQLRGSRVEAAVLAALTEGTGTTVPATQERAPFPLRAPGSFDGGHVDQAVTVTPFSEGLDAFALIEIRDVSGTVDRERQLLDHAETLRARSFADGLTGIANRRYFDVALSRELRRAQRLGTPLALMLMDIDAFKAYNDHFGHPEGDACLKRIAQALAGVLKRPADVAARYGGEEFAAVLPDTTAEQARTLAETLRSQVAALAIAHAPAAGRAHVTLSIGIASHDKVALNEAALLVEAADQALYRAKRGGRDRVVVDGDA